MKIQLKRSNVLESGRAKEPSADQLEYGEVVVNYNETDPAIFIKDSRNHIIRIAGHDNIADDGTTNVPAGQDPPDPAEAGNLWFNTDEGRLYIYYVEGNTEEWVDASPDVWDNSVIPDLDIQDPQDGTIDNRYVMLSGDDMTGDLTLGIDNITLHADEGSITAVGQIDIGSKVFCGNTDEVEAIVIPSTGNATVEIFTDGAANFASGNTTIESGDANNNQHGLIQYLHPDLIDNNYEIESAAPDTILPSKGYVKKLMENVSMAFKFVGTCDMRQAPPTDILVGDVYVHLRAVPGDGSDPYEENVGDAMHPDWVEAWNTDGLPDGASHPLPSTMLDVFLGDFVGAGVNWWAKIGKVNDIGPENVTQNLQSVLTKGHESSKGIALGCDEPAAGNDPDASTASIVLDSSGSITAAAQIETLSGGFKFPDGTIQTTAAFNADAPGDGLLTIETYGHGASASGSFSADQYSDSTLTLPQIRYADISGTPSIPSVGDGALTIKTHGESKSASGTFTANQSGGSTLTLPQIRYTDISGTPTIPPAAGNGSLTIKTHGEDASATGTFTANQSGASTLTLPPIRYSDLTGVPSIPGAGDGALTIKTYGHEASASGSFTANQASGSTIVLPQIRYSDLSGLPSIPSGAGNGALTIKTYGHQASASGSFTANQSGASTVTLPQIRYADISGTPSIPSAAGNGSLEIVTYGENAKATGSFSANQSSGSTLTLPQIRYADISGKPTIPSVSPTNLSHSTSLNSVTISSSTGSDTTIQEATTGKAGIMGASQVSTLSSASSNATSALTQADAALTQANTANTNASNANANANNRVLKAGDTGIGTLKFGSGDKIVLDSSSGNITLGNGAANDASGVILQQNGGVKSSRSSTSYNVFEGYCNTGSNLSNPKIYIRASGLININNNEIILDPNGEITAKADAEINGIRFGRGPGNASSNTCVGNDALYSNTSSGMWNTAVGYFALRGNTSGGENTAIGYYTLRKNTTGKDNTAVGSKVLGNNTEGKENTGIGVYALDYNTTGRDNTAIGWSSLRNNTEAGFNTAVGSGAMYDLRTGASNTAVGYAALWGRQGDHNTGVGRDALKSNQGQRNVAIGADSLRLNQTGNNNTGLGYKTFDRLTSGEKNTALGYYSGTYQSNGAVNDTLENMTFVGAYARGSGSHQVQLGDSSTTTYAFGAVQDRSDARDKTDIRDTLLGLEFINSLRPVDFRWDYRDDYFDKEEYEVNETRTRQVRNTAFVLGGEEPEFIDEEFTETITEMRLVPRTKDGSRSRGRFHHGLIAQEVKAAADAQGIDFAGYQDHSVNGGDDVLSIGYTELIAPLIKAVQELSAENADLKSRLVALEALQ